MANIVQHKRSSSAGSTPTTSDLAVGEIGINTADAKMFTNNGSAVVELGGDVTDTTTVTAAGALMTSGGTMTGNLKLDDSVDVRMGTHNDFKLLHNGTNSKINNTNGALQISNFADNQDVTIAADDGSGGTAVYFRADGSTGDAILYHYGSEKLKTQSGGVDIQGTLTATGVDVTDSNNIGRFGGDGSTGGVTLANGYVDIRGKSVSEATYVNFYCESSNAHAVKLQAPAHADFSGNITATLPNVTGTLVTSDAQRRIEVVSSLPSSPDANTIYFVT